MPNPLLRNRQLASDVGRSNLLTNGGFEIWQRGNGPFSNPLGTQTADRWQCNTGTDTISISKDTTNMDVGSQACAAVTFTRNASNTALGQILKWTDLNGLRGKTVSATLRVKPSIAAGIRLAMNFDGTGSGTTNGPANVGTGAYETLTITATLPPDGTYVWLQIVPLLSGTFYLDNAMLVVGSQPADYAPLHPADDLARCLRYYEQPSGYLAAGYFNSTTQSLYPFQYKAVKAITPTVTLTPASLLVQSGANQSQTPTAASASAAPNSCQVNVTTPAFNAPVGPALAGVLLEQTAGSIRIEANP